jgi:rare lipoprotein A
MFRSRTYCPPCSAAAFAFFALVLTLFMVEAAASKAPGQRHCYGGVCHRVMTLGETRAQVGKLRRIVASHYDDCSRDRFNPCGLTSSGEVFRPDAADNTASAIHPDGTILLVHNPATKLAAVVRVNNFGPFRGNRQLDVSRATAERLGFAKRGVAPLDVLVLQAPSLEEARYKRKRRYEAVAGFIGKAESVEHAYLHHAELAQRQRFSRLAAAACHLARNQRAPRLALLGVTAKSPGIRA